MGLAWAGPASSRPHRSASPLGQQNVRAGPGAWPWVWAVCCPSSSPGHLPALGLGQGAVSREPPRAHRHTRSVERGSPREGVPDTQRQPSVPVSTSPRPPRVSTSLAERVASSLPTREKAGGSSWKALGGVRRAGGGGPDSMNLFL